MADWCTWRPPRACDDYWSEWKHCRSIRNLFHHYYTYGESPSCEQWKKDYENCREWEKTKSSAARDSLRKSEKERTVEKQKHAPVWNLRESPPMDWYLPLDEGKTKTLMLLRRAFHQAGAREEKALTLAEDNRMLLGPRTTNRLSEEHHLLVDM